MQTLESVAIAKTHAGGYELHVTHGTETIVVPVPKLHGERLMAAEELRVRREDAAARQVQYAIDNPPPPPVEKPQEPERYLDYDVDGNTVKRTR